MKIIFLWLAYVVPGIPSCQEIETAISAFKGIPDYER